MGGGTSLVLFFFQAEDGIRDHCVTGVQTCALPISVAARLRQLLRSSTGIILVTGPTGSGKSTTLFGALKSVYQPGIKILTAENPIEYRSEERRVGKECRSRWERKQSKINSRGYRRA